MERAKTTSPQPKVGLDKVSSTTAAVVQNNESKKIQSIIVEQLYHEIIRLYSDENSILFQSRELLNDDNKKIENKLESKQLDLEENSLDDFSKLDAIGFSTGHRFISRITLNRSFFKTELEIIKFFCKEFWMEAFGKKVDKLQTNHKGVYVLHDQDFIYIRKISLDTELGNENNQALKSVAIPCGIIRGALSNLGIESEIHANIRKLPHCEFVIKIVNNMYSKKESSEVKTL